MIDEPWYGAKCIFRHSDSRNEAKYIYEERIVLIKAKSFDEAIERAEKDANDYAQSLEGCSYLDFVNIFHLFDKTISNGTEVYSLMRGSDLNEKEYLDNFYDTGLEHTR